jgi:glycosyltransferase involved in cell wall biosynthesis
MARDYKPVGIPLSAVFCARVFKEKGIEEAVAAVDRINEIADATMIQLDVYGPVEESYAKRFEQLVARSPTTRYMGTLEPSILHTALQRYDVMLFPTYYSDEGFPGTIVDAYIAGVPVLASRWAYNTELIELGRTGAICSPHSVEDLTKALMQFVAAPQLLTEMRTHCIARARDYHVDRVMGAFLRDLAATG